MAGHFIDAFREGRIDQTLLRGMRNAQNAGKDQSQLVNVLQKMPAELQGPTYYFMGMKLKSLGANPLAFICWQKAYAKAPEGGILRQLIAHEMKPTEPK